MYIFSIEPASFDSRRMAAKKDSFKIIKLADPLNFIGVLIALGGLVVGILRMTG